MGGKSAAQVNERAARVVAGVTAGSLALAAWVDVPWVVPLVALGFVVRSTVGPRFSLLARLSSTIAAKLWPIRRVPAAPKRFAQAVGAVLTSSSALLLLGSKAPHEAGWALSGVVIACATLEAGLGFCLGCWVYGQLQRLGVLPADACPQCADAPPAERPLTAR